MIKLSISNIGWDSHQNHQIFKLMREYGFEGVEIAPTKVFKDPLNLGMDEIKEYLKYINSYGLKLSAMQSLLYGKPELKLFDDSKRNTIKYLKKIIVLAQQMNIKILVFGSPKNRIRGQMTYQQAFDIAAGIFKELGDYANDHNCYLCIEPNAKEYGCDFITNTREALEIVKAVNSKGFRFHLDSAVCSLNNEDIESSLSSALPFMEHFHISEPYLEIITNDKTNHIEYATCLMKINYSNWVSIEMKKVSDISNYDAIKKSLRYVSKIYR